MNPQRIVSRFMVASGHTFTESREPLTHGSPRLCFENARKEYWAWKARGEDPQYWRGSVVGYKVGDDLTKRPLEVDHAWVVVNGSTVADPTPFKYGVGNWVDLPQMPAREYWLKGVKYEGRFLIPEESLLHTLTFWPKSS